MKYLQPWSYQDRKWQCKSSKYLKCSDNWLWHVKQGDHSNSSHNMKYAWMIYETLFPFKMGMIDLARREVVTKNFTYLLTKLQQIYYKEWQFIRCIVICIYKTRLFKSYLYHPYDILSDNCRMLMAKLFSLIWLAQKRNIVIRSIVCAWKSILWLTCLIPQLGAICTLALTEDPS